MYFITPLETRAHDPRRIPHGKRGIHGGPTTPRHNRSRSCERRFLYVGLETGAPGMAGGAQNAPTPGMAFPLGGDATLAESLWAAAAYIPLSRIKTPTAKRQNRAKKLSRLAVMDTCPSTCVSGGEAPDATAMRSR